MYDCESHFAYEHKRMLESIFFPGYTQLRSMHVVVCAGVEVHSRRSEVSNWDTAAENADRVPLSQGLFPGSLLL